MKVEDKAHQLIMNFKDYVTFNEFETYEDYKQRQKGLALEVAQEVLKEVESLSADNEGTDWGRIEYWNAVITEIERVPIP